MAKAGWPYWGGFATLAAASLGMLFAFVFGFLPQRFLLELDFAESGFAYPVIQPPLPEPPPPPVYAPRRPIARGPAERFWAEYVPLATAGEDSAAAVLIQDYLSRYPNDLGATLEYGRTLWRLGELDAAIVAYRRAIDLGANGAAQLELARLLVGARRWNDALSVYANLVRSNPNDLELLREYAETATWAQRYDLAIELYSELVERSPDDAGLRLQYARVLYWAGQPERAEEILTSLPAGYASASVDSLLAAIAIALPPPPPTPETMSTLDRARTLMLAGSVDSALVLYRLHMAEEPVTDSLLIELADVFEYRAFEPDSARVYLHTYLGRNPEDQTVRLRLARLLAWDGQYVEAERSALTIVNAEPDDAEAWVLLGDIYRWSDDRKAAKEAYKRALEIDPKVVGANEGLASIDAQVELQLSRQGTIGPAGWFDFFADNDEFTLARFRGEWTGGSPRTRWGGEMAVESLEGFSPTVQRTDMMAIDVRAEGEHWFMDGGLNARAWAGAWIPDTTSTQPLFGLALAAPDWGGSAYRFEYRHGPAYRETNTMQAAVADLRADVFRLEFYRPISVRWTMSAVAGFALFSGVGDANQRYDASLSFLYRLTPAWAVGYETRGLGFADAAPNPGLRLYWDPEWYWLNAGVVNWSARPGMWELAVQATLGAAWMRERDVDPTVEAQFGIVFDAVRRFGAWGVGGRAVYAQTRADGYRAFRLELEASRGFGR